MAVTIVAAVLFVLTYAALVAEKAHKTVVALVGGSAMLLAMGLLRVTAGEAGHRLPVDLFHHVDLNVILLLAGMMVIVNVMQETGVFHWAAIRAAKAARGEPMRILVLFALIAAAFSAFLDNVTTVVLIAPVTILVANQLKLDPVPFLVTEVLSSNVGGTATLIGDPPNILIGSAAHLSFLAFLWNLAPIVVVLMGAILLSAWLLFHRRLHVSNELKALIMDYDERRAIKDPRLLRTCLIVGVLTLTAFLLHGVLGVQPAAVALGGASVLLLITKADPAKALERVEWTTLFFFIGLFLVVGGAQEAGVLRWLTRLVPSSAARHPMATGVGTLWVSGLLSGVVDNIPLTAAAIPVLRDIITHTRAPEAAAQGLWWCLALGACLGGNATAVGASANVVVIGIAERSGCPISFRRFLLYGLPFTLLSLAFCTLYVWLRYFLF